MAWWDQPLYCIDEGEGPAVMTCTYDGKDGIAVLAFTRSTLAQQYVYRYCGPYARVREFGRRSINGKMTHNELAGWARSPKVGPDTAMPAVAMVVDVNASTEWVSIDDVATLGLRQRQAVRVKDELYD
jgi:hypothetical protein